MPEIAPLDEKIPVPLEARIVEYSTGEARATSGMATSLIGKALRVSVPSRIALLAPVTVECGNKLWMGEVVACSPAPYGFDVEIDAAQSLEDVEGVERMASHFRRAKIPTSGAPRQRETDPSLA